MPFGGVGDGAGVLDRRGDGLVEQQPAARGGRAYGERGLDVRREGEGGDVAVGEELVGVFVHLHAVCLGQLGRGFGPAAPDADELGAGVCGEGGGVGTAGPGAGAQQADPGTGGRTERFRGVADGGHIARNTHRPSVPHSDGRADANPHKPPDVRCKPR